MEFTTGNILFGIFYLIVLTLFFIVLPVALGSLYLWFVLKMFHNKKFSFWNIVGTSFFSYVVILISGIVTTLLFSPMFITKNINGIGKIFSYYSIIFIAFSSIMGIFTGTLCIRKLIKKSWSYSLLISILVFILTATTFYLIFLSPIGGFIIPPD